MLLALSILSRAKDSFSTLIKRIKKYHFSGEINFQVGDKNGIIQQILSDYRQGQLTGIDGIRLDFPSWWFNLRKSNTEPYLRLVVEAESPEELQRRTEELMTSFQPGWMRSGCWISLLLRLQIFGQR